jgi:hypothetical protein
VVSFAGASLEELDFELSFELSLDEESFDELSDLGLSSDLSLELDGGCGDHLLDLAPAFGALRDHLVRELLDFFEAVTALLTFVFVKWHELRRL